MTRNELKIISIVKVIRSRNKRLFDEIMHNVYQSNRKHFSKVNFLEITIKNEVDLFDYNQMVEYFENHESLKEMNN